MARGWMVAAAVLAFVHAGASLLGAVGFGLTADQAEPMSPGEAGLVIFLIAAMAVAMFVCAILLLVGKLWPVFVVACASLAISLYVMARWAGQPGAYEIPLLFAVLPTAVAVIVGVGLRRRGAVPA